MSVGVNATLYRSDVSSSHNIDLQVYNSTGDGVVGGGGSNSGSSGGWLQLPDDVVDSIDKIITSVNASTVPVGVGSVSTRSDKGAAGRVDGSPATWTASHQQAAHSHLQTSTDDFNARPDSSKLIVARKQVKTPVWRNKKDSCTEVKGFLGKFHFLDSDAQKYKHKGRIAPSKTVSYKEYFEVLISLYLQKFTSSNY